MECIKVLMVLKLLTKCFVSSETARKKRPLKKISYNISYFNCKNNISDLKKTSISCALINIFGQISTHIPAALPH